ncbi:hypothetical protein JCM31447_05260 [Fluviispira sanaruensis]|uniref:Uncharacterized protein n=2 Tax=Fluviispira sanaruensis TaxID=2493639 RepID=A0A4P2VL56_FLUSA|nr:hypothetical protein JCM31447_05260 [Fluviispira sanaruensis]
MIFLRYIYKDFGIDLSYMYLRIWTAYSADILNKKMKLNKTNKTDIFYTLFKIVPFILFLSIMFYCLILNYNEKNQYKIMQENLIEVPVLYPSTAPEKNNQCILLAMALFSIDKNKNSMQPVYDPSLNVRGLTSGMIFSPKKNIYIGDEAFENWGLLGSTLAHEVEIHGNQSFVEIEFINFLYHYVYEFKYNLLLHLINKSDVQYKNKKIGTIKAEKEAYKYELKSKNRFSLNAQNEKSLQYILENKLYENDI